jgi:protein-tyrosine phosphatase
MHILFVCSGNTCRSPMAEALLMEQLKTKPTILESEPIIQSAGIYALDGSSASHEAIKVMAEMGINICGHRARQLNLDLVQWADLILTMTEAHKREIISRYDVSADKIYTLADFGIGEQTDVIDPFGSGIEAYRQCAGQIKTMIIEMIKKFT